MILFPRPPWLKTLEPHQLKRWIDAARRGECGPVLTDEQRLQLGTLLYPMEEQGELYQDDPLSDGAALEWAPEWRPVPFARFRPASVAELPWTFERPRFAHAAERWDPEERLDLGPHDVWLHGPYGDWDDCRCFDEPVRPDDLRWEREEDASVLVIDEVMRVHPTHAVWDEYTAPESDELFQAFREATGWLLYDEAMARVLLEPLRCLGCQHIFEFDYNVSARLAPVEPPACPACGGSALALAHDPAPASLTPTESARRLVEALVACGALTLRGDPPLSAVRRALAAPMPQRAAALARSLLAAETVEELYLSDAHLDLLLDAW